MNHVQNRTHLVETNSNSPGRSRTTKEREQSSVSRLLIIHKQIIRNHKRTVQTNNRDANHQRRSQKRSNARHKHHNDRTQRKAKERLSIGESPSKHDERLIRRAENVEEHPPGEEADEDEERERMREEREGEDEGDDGGVVHLEVGEILPDPG